MLSLVRPLFVGCALALVLPIFTQPAFAHETPVACEAHLLAERLDLIENFQRYVIDSKLTESVLFELPEDPIPLEIPYHRAVINPMPWVSVWTGTDSDSGDFLLIDTGFKNLERDSNNIHRLILQLMREHPNRSFKILYDKLYDRARRLTNRYRWLLHQAVLGLYRERKAYLSPREIKLMTNINLVSGNSDVLALVRFQDGLPLSHLSLKEVRERLALTLQISYAGERNYLHPNIIDLMINAGIPPRAQNMALPFEARLSPTKSSLFREKFETRFPREETCEYTRYGLFAKVPRALHDRLLLYAMQMTVARGMKYVVAGGDSATSRLFRRYGFEEFSPLPTERNEEPEFLSYIEVDSPAWNRTLERLMRANAVHPGEEID